MENTLTQSFNPLDIALKINEGDETYFAELMRKTVGEIVGSYHYQFDHLYECLQNAVDACEEAFSARQTDLDNEPYSPLIRVTVDLEKNQIAVADNGIGMSREVVLKYFFTPYATRKPKFQEQGLTRQRGEKGVGAAFLSYGTNFIHLSTRSMKTGDIMSGQLRNGLKWCNGEVALIPMPTVDPCEPHQELEHQEHGTIVTIRFSEDTNLGSLEEHAGTLDQWEAILRLHTALGYIDLDPQNKDPFLKLLRATLVLVDRNGRVTSKSVETGYFYPHLLTESNVTLSSLSRDKKGRLHDSQRDMNLLWDIFTYDQVSALVTERMEKTKYLRLKKRQSISRILNKHKPEAYVALTYSASFWEECNHRIWGMEGIDQFDHGIVFATRSQRIGERLRIDFTSRTGDFNRFLIVLNMRDLRGDIGRKSLQEEIGEFANFFANAVHRAFSDDDDCLRPTPGAFPEEQERELEDLRDRAHDLEPIGLEGLDFVKIPTEEQDVIALFFDLLGAKLLRGYTIYASHIHRVYDGVGRFSLDNASDNVYHSGRNPLGIASDKFDNKGMVDSPKRCFIEFKFSTDGLVKDIRGGYKRLQDIKWLVCWEIGDKHRDEQIGITDITLPSQINQRDYYGVTHLMTENQDKVYVICLEKVIEILKSRAP